MSPKKFDVAEDDEPGTVPAVRSGSVRRRRPHFGSYMDAELQREFKIACIADGIEMQDGLEQAVRLWLSKRSTT
ncbi:hypothetical protein AB0M94_38840 [Streptomyces xanthochromogenes]|uniref:hypothetical protein n=1 Tax=Streptomyces xanthochromogenes TaxID=67384 RepID=UPI00341F16AA